ncbi:serine/threonine-protein kinase [Tsukamurella sp. NPDC003166]|uniref:serine/threonine-protein kinase n=1 Tax=Tsukamurella sp. NPDC003166 TaxID=3154444 RepID=UPI0033B57496
MGEQRDGEEIAGYRIIRSLGAGGMGDVYLVQHPRLPRRDALKLLDRSVSRDSDFRARFERESDVLASLSHPNIVTLYDRGEHDGRLWLTMELVDGSDAAHLLRERGPLPADLAFDVLAGAAAGLDAAWEDQRITHRDVKPANILVGFRPDGSCKTVKVADFGIAKAASEATSLTSTGMTVGTLAYIAPEALDGQPVDNRADVYSLGCTAFQLLTGSTPYTSASTASLITAHLHHPVPRISERNPRLAAALDAVFEKALAKRPGDRYSSCGEFVQALRASGVSSVPAPATAPAASPEDTPTLVRAPETLAGPLAASAGGATSGAEDTWTAVPAPGAWSPAPPLWDPTPAEPTTAPAAPQSRPALTRRKLIIGGVVVAVAAAGGIGVLAAANGGHDSRPANVIATIPVGKYPTRIAITPNGAMAYVLNGVDGEGSVSVIDTATNKVTATIATERNGSDLAMTPDGGTVYVADASPGKVAAISTATNAVMATVPVMGYAGLTGIAVSPNGKTAYVINAASGIAAIDTTTNKVISAISGAELVQSTRLAVTPDGRTVYALTASGSSNSVVVVDLTSNRITTSFPFGTSPSASDMAITPDGRNAYVPTGDGTVSVVSTTTNKISATISVPSGDRVAITPSGATAYVTNRADKTISVIDTAANKVIATIPTGREPQDMALFPNSTTAYVTNARDNTVSAIALT